MFGGKFFFSSKVLVGSYFLEVRKNLYLNMTLLGLLLIGLLASDVMATCVGSVPNGKVQDTEECDDGNAVNGDGCSRECLMEKGYYCSLATFGGSDCYVLCGDGLRLGSEGLLFFKPFPYVRSACDDGNTIANDGCTGCTVDANYVCFDNLISPPYPRSTCVGLLAHLLYC
jgi:cysteine-rich repeat protein